MSDIKYDELCNMIANEVRAGHPSRKSADRYLQAIYKVILRQLELNHRVYFKDFGYFELREHKSGERNIIDPVTKEQRIVYVKPKYSIFFKPSTVLEHSVNDYDFKKTTKSKIKRLPKGGRCNTTADLINRSRERSKKRNEANLRRQESNQDCGTT